MANYRLPLLHISLVNLRSRFGSQCTRSGIAKVRFGSGTAEIGTQVDRLLQADCIVLDLVALLTIRELELSEYLRIRFPRVAVPQLVIDEIQKQYSLTVAQQGPAGWLGKSSEGGYAFTDVSDQGWDEWRGYLRSLLEFAESFDRVPSYPMLDVTERAELIDVITSHGAGAIFAGDETDEGAFVVVSDDLGLSELAQSYGIETVNTQAVSLGVTSFRNDHRRILFICGRAPYFVELLVRESACDRHCSGTREEFVYDFTRYSDDDKDS